MRASLHNAWADGPSESYEAESLFPITIKKSRNQRGHGGVTVGYDEDAELRAALAASVADSAKGANDHFPTVASKLFGSRTAPSLDDFPGLAGASKLPPATTSGATLAVVVKPAVQRHEQEREEQPGAEGVQSPPIPAASIAPIPSPFPAPIAAPIASAAPDFSQRAIALPIGIAKAVALPMASSAKALPMSSALSLPPASSNPVALPLPAPAAYTPPPVLAAAMAPAAMIAPTMGRAIVPPQLASSPMPTPLVPSVISQPPLATASSSAPTVAAPPLPKLDVVASVAASDSPTCVLMLHHLPACITIQHLGSQFCAFGKVQVRQLFTIANGLTAVITYQTVEAAMAAMQAMTGRVYELETHYETGTEMEQWTVQPGFARHPVQLVRPGTATIKYIGM